METARTGWCDATWCESDRLSAALSHHGPFYANVFDFLASPTPPPPPVDIVAATVVAARPFLFLAYCSAIKAERRAVMIQSFVRMRVVYVRERACRRRDIFGSFILPTIGRVAMREVGARSLLYTQ